MSELSSQTLIDALAARAPEVLEGMPDARWAAVNIVLHPLPDRDWAMLFIKRAAHEQDPWSGHMAFPGGRVDPEDTSPFQAALRETQEELALDLLEHTQLIGQLNDVQAIARGKIMPMVIRPFVFMARTRPETTPNYEVEEVVWIPLSFLLSGQGNGIYHWHRAGKAIELPCTHYQGYTVWGLTHYMLSDLLERLRVHAPAPAHERSSP